MNSSNGLRQLLNVSKGENLAPKIFVVATLLLVAFAYLPTLQFDYVAEDQWRAFRYSVAAGSALERAKDCAHLIAPFYIQTGRPLVWMTECIGHAAVAKIADFALLRPVGLAAALITVVYLGNVLSRLVGGLVAGVTAAAILVLSSGYSFMYFQNMPALMVLVSVILAAASYDSFSRRNESSENRLGRLFVAGVLFIIASLIYPAYAFIVLPLALLEFGFDVSKGMSRRMLDIAFALIFYAACAALYYALVKIGIAALRAHSGALPNLGAYQVAIQLDPLTILRRLQQAALYFFSMPPSNFSAPPAVCVGILALFSIVGGVRSSKGSMEGGAAGKAVLYSLLIFIVGSVVLAGSISPWIFSRMPSLSTRHLLPWYLFYAATFVGLLSFAIQRLLRHRPSCWIHLGVLTSCVLLVAIVQNRISFLEVWASNIEIHALRQRISSWAEKKGWKIDRYLLVILPKVDRPSQIGGLMRNTLAGDANATLASAHNPVSIPWMITAVMREHFEKLDFNLIDCAYSGSCVNSALKDPANVVVEYADQNAQISIPASPYIINFSLLTSRPARNLRLVRMPDIKATSTLDNLGPGGLLDALEPGWHASKDPSYPQSVIIDFRKTRSFRTVEMLPQHGHAERMPRSVDIATSENGHSWTNVLKLNDICDAHAIDGWRQFSMNKPVKARYIRLEIHSNCGDPHLLTLRGIKLN